MKIFPWEGRLGKPTRVFPEESTSTHEREREHEHGHEHEQITTSSEWEEEESVENVEKSGTGTLASWKPPSPSPSPSMIEREEAEEKPTPSFENYTHSNAWDEVPEIQQYIESIQKARETRRSQGPSGAGTPVSLSLSTPSTPSVAVRGSYLRLGDLGLSSASLSSSSDDKGSEKERNIPTTEPPQDLIQDEWTSLTTDGFVRLLQFMYLYCIFATTTKGAGASSTQRG